MAIAVPDPSFPGSRAATRRFALAVTASAIAHLFVVQSLVLDMPQRAARPAGGGAIAVRLEPPAGAIAPVPEPPPVAPRVSPGATAGGGRTVAAARSGTRSKRESVAPLALPRAPDPNYYAAGDLDVYPRPAAPLDLDRLALGVTGGGAGRFRLALLIDEGGVVNEIAVIEAEPPGPLQEVLRAAFAATRFFPGQKGGRAVKSRVLLRVDFDPARVESAAR